MFTFLVSGSIALGGILVSHLVGAAVVVAARRIRLWFAPPPKARRKPAQRLSVACEVRQVLHNTLYAENLAFAAMLTGVCRIVLFFVSLAMMAWNCCRAVARGCVNWVRAGFHWTVGAICSFTGRVLSFLGFQPRSNQGDGTLRDQLEQSLRHALENGRPQLATQG